MPPFDTTAGRRPVRRFVRRRLRAPSRRPGPVASPRSASGAFRAIAGIAGRVVVLLVPGLVATLPAHAEDAGAAADPLPRATLETNRGDIGLQLFRERAPKTVANFLDYVDDGFYDGTVFHRVIEGFMIQGGGFDTSLVKRPTRDPIDNEADNGLGNRRYTIAMARTNAPRSATAQFFINVADNRNLDHTAPTARGWGYAVFGEVVDGRDVVDAISEVATGATGPFGADVPREPVVILHAVRVGTRPAADDGTTGRATERPAREGGRPAADDASTGGASSAERVLPGLSLGAGSGGTN